MRRFLVTTLLALWLAGQAGAAEFKDGPITMNISFSSLPSSVQTALSTAGITEESVFNLMRDKLNVLYNLPTQQTFLKSMSEANAAASRGQGIDFGSNLKYAIAGLDFAVAYDNGTNPFYDFSNLNAFDIE